MPPIGMTIRLLTTVCVATLLKSSPLIAAEAQYLELEQKYAEWRADYVVHDDFTVEATEHFVLQALTDNAARELNTYSFSYSTSIEKAEVLAAYTLKSDGQKLDVPKDNYQITINRGNEDGGPVFSDRTRMTIVYPDLEAGDSIVLTLRQTESEPMFPGEFSIARYFYNQTAYDEAHVTVAYPTRMDPQVQIRGMEKREVTEEGRTLIGLSYSNPKPFKSEREDYSVWEWEEQDGFAVSTFSSYEEIARAYGARALPKAQPNDRVRTLAAEIVGGEENPTVLARLLYDWVATNIDYAGNCIGVGAVVPHDLEFILDNRMGDCKDHATLLQALYTSVGIKSDQALINSGGSYSLPAIPMVSSVNHVITYLPDLDRFVDSTNASMPFDLLSFSVSDKPVLLVQDYVADQRTPASQWQVDGQNAESTITVNPDGSASGTMSVQLAGTPAAQARAIWRQLSRQEEEEWLNGQFSSPSAKGSATIDRDDPTALKSEYAYQIDFEVPELIPGEGAGGMYLATPGYTPHPLLSYAAMAASAPVEHEVACSNGYSMESLRYVFPDNVRILAVPDDFSLQENHLEFTASYQLDDQTLVVERELKDKTPGNVCSVELTNAQRESLLKISKNLRSQLVFQYL